MQSATPRRAILALLLIVLLAAAVRLVVFRGYSGLDDAEYARFAYLQAEGRERPGNYEGPAVFPLRVGVVVPTAMGFRLFGAGERTMVLYPFIVSLASVILAYVCAAVFFGWRAGLIAAVLLSVFFWDVDSATRLLPDLPAAFLAAVGVTVLAAFAARAVTPGQLAFGGAVAGLAFGASWLSKEVIAYLAPFTLAMIAVTVKSGGRRLWYLWAGFVGGSAAVLGAETLTYYLSTGDPLFRLHEVERNYRQWENGFFTEGSDYGWPAGMTRAEAIRNRLLISGPARIFLDESFYYVPLIAALATIYAWWRKDRAFLIPAIWFWSLALMFNFASSSSSSYVPLALYYRYLYPLYMPAIVLTAGLLARVLVAADESTFRGAHLWRARAAGVALLVVMLSAAVPRLYYMFTASNAEWLQEVRELRQMVAPGTPLVADALTLRGLEFFAGYPERTKWTSFEELGSGGAIPADSLVVVNKRYIEWLDRNAGMWVKWPGPAPMELTGYRQHPFYAEAPRSWSLVSDNGNAKVYRVGER